MTDITTLHRQAMDLAEEAFEAKRDGSVDRAQRLLQAAFEKERDAAELAVRELNVEPTRSILFRSAASLAVQAGYVRDAEKLIAIALAGEPPADVAEELRDLLEQVNFRRHLELRGIELDRTEIQLSIAGDAVGYGISDSREFLNRVEIAQKLAYRTAERRRGQPYRDRGKPRDDLAKELEVYVSVPRAASFAVSLRFGAPEQLTLSSDTRDTFIKQTIDELLDCLKLFDASEFAALRKRIPDPAYYRNFVGLAKNFAPDGKNVRVVGLTAAEPEGPRYVALSTPRTRIEREIQAVPEVERVTITGELRYADSRHASDKIQLITTEKTAVPIKVPQGMMSDVVRPMWETIVTVVARKEGRSFILESISPAEDKKRREDLSGMPGDETAG
jgi:hypothetical protein